MTPRYIGYDAHTRLDWGKAIAALRRGHALPRPQIGDLFLGPKSGTLLTRGAFVPGLGYGVKSVTVMPDNPAQGRPTVQGAMFVFAPDTGEMKAVIDSQLVTEFKTCADSALGATLLARPDARRLLIVGAGTVARGLVRAYTAAFPDLEQIAVWARNPTQSATLAAEFDERVEAVASLPEAVAQADIVAAATMATTPILKGEWIAPGTHVDLIGAFRPDMREADDALISGGRLFVDCRETTLAHIGELSIPLASGVITESDVLGDFYDLIGDGMSGRETDRDITVFKNGGGAHLDLMMADYIAAATD